MSARRIRLDVRRMSAEQQPPHPTTHSTVGPYSPPFASLASKKALGTGTPAISARNWKGGASFTRAAFAHIGALAYLFCVLSSTDYHPGASWKPVTQFLPGRWNGWARYASKIMYPKKLTRAEMPALNTGMRSVQTIPNPPDVKSCWLMA